MLRLVVIVLVLAALWMGWWAFGSVAYERGLSAWIDTRRAEGWAADVGTLETRGFPNRFDTTLTDVRLADPETGVAWSAPFVQFLSLAYKPHQVIAVLPEEHVFSTPLQTVTITHDRARGSLFLDPSPALPLDSARVVLEDLALVSTLGWSLALDEARFAVDSVPATDNTYRIGGEMLALRPSADARAALDPTGALPNVIDQLRLDATLRFTDRWDRRALEEARPQITAIDLTDLSARWGNVTFRAAGELAVDGQGIPTGELTLRAVEWRRVLRMATGSGLIADQVAGSLESVLALMSGPGDTLDIPLTFRGGAIRLGPIPLGPAPRLVIR